MHILAQRVVQQAIAAGAQLDVLRDFDDLRELDRLAGEMAGRSRELDVLFPPARVIGGVRFRAPSLAALCWVDRAEGWFGTSSDRFALAVAFALATPACELWPLADPERAALAIDDWAARCTATPDQLALAAETLLPKPDPAQLNRRRSAQPGSPDYGAVLARLQRSSAMPPEYWIFEASSEQTLQQLEKAREHEGLMLAAAQGVAHRDPDRWEISAHARFADFSRTWLAKVTPQPDPATCTPPSAS